MENIRKTIEDKYENLQQLEDYEGLLEHINTEGKGHWWKITTPRKEVEIGTDKTRDKFVMFISDEIIRIKRELGLED